MKTIVAHSAKGGTGKTTFSVNLAYHLQKAGKKVVLCDFDVTGPSLNFIFNTFDSLKKTKFINDYLSDPSLGIKQLIKPVSIPNTNEKIDTIFSNPWPSSSSVYKQIQKLLSMKPDHLVPNFKKLVFEIASQKTDYLVIDNSAGIHQISILPLFFMNIGFLVLRPNIYGHKGTESILSESYLKLKGLGDTEKKFYLVLNFLSENIDNEDNPVLSRWKKEFSDTFGAPIIKSFNCYCHSWDYTIDGNIIFPQNSNGETKIKEIVSLILN